MAVKTRVLVSDESYTWTETIKQVLVSWVREIVLLLIVLNNSITMLSHSI
jgi:hypothetical protein